ncbi:hypothetical protein HK405_014551, partial [Cladochytrium tenue]
AVARASGARFLSVALSDIFDKYVGEGEKNVRAMFSLARKLAPCVVFLDEVDALFGARRGGDGLHSSKREIINEFMSEWDGLAGGNRGVVVMGATNRPFDLDDAILRRMPRRVLIDLPDEAARLKILEAHLRDENLAPDVSLEGLARRTPFFSGSDLKNLCISAALASVKESVARPLFEATPQEDAATASAVAAGDDGATAAAAAPLSTEEVLRRIDSLESWADLLPGDGSSPGVSSAAGSSTATSSSSSSPPPPPPRSVSAAHFEVALKEVAPSLADDAPSLVELRRWDEQYGDGAARRRDAAGGRRGWGFAAAAAQPAGATTP